MTTVSDLLLKSIDLLKHWVFIYDDAYINSWHLNNLFVAEATFFNITVTFFILCFWILNRQTHIRDTKGSKIKYKVDEEESGSEVETADSSDVDEDLNKENGDLNGLENYLSEEKNELKKSRRRRKKTKRKKFNTSKLETFANLDRVNIEFDEDDLSVVTDDEKVASDTETDKHQRKKERSKEETGLWEVLKNIKLFSFLDQNALDTCIAHTEFIDLKKGEFIFCDAKYLSLTQKDGNIVKEFDGSLYAVVSGSVKCTFHDYPLPDNAELYGYEEEYDEDDENGLMEKSKDKKRVLETTSCKGDVITSLLSMLVGMTENYLGASFDVNTPSVSAYALEENTRVIRVPPECFSLVLKNHPAEVFRVTQTILSRVQRVTIQTLIKTLGLRKELIEEDGDGMTLHKENELPGINEWKELQTFFYTQTKEQNNRKIFGGILESPLSIKSDIDIKRKSIVVAASLLGFPLTKDDTNQSSNLDMFDILQKESSLIRLNPGESLVDAGETSNSVYLFLSGNMEIGVPVPRGKRSWSFDHRRPVLPGSLLGLLTCFAGDSSLFTSRCCSSDKGEQSILLEIPKSVFYKMLIQNPKTMTLCLKFFIAQVPSIVHLLLWSSDWLFLKAAEGIAKIGDKCDSMAIVINGRLRAHYPKKSSSLHKYSSKSSKSSPHHFNEAPPYDEFGRGKIVGDIGCLTGSRWPCDVYAIRNSEVVIISMETLLAIIQAHPSGGLYFAKVMATQFHNRKQSDISSGISRSSSLLSSVSPLKSYGLSLSTIAVVPLSSDINHKHFCSTLKNALMKIAPTALITKAMTREHLGNTVYRNRNSLFNLRMTRLLANMEENNRLVLYEADKRYTWWTKLCIMQADCILLVVSADRAPEEQKIEQSLIWAYKSMDVRIELVVVGKAPHIDEEVDLDEEYEFDEKVNVSDHLNNWSEQRPWIVGHHLIRTPFSLNQTDFQRMCRRVAGLSVGLVLGGGGARGLAHLGVLRALKEAGIVVDLVGGVSQGAFIGALFAKNPDNIDEVFKATREYSDSMSSIKEKLLDLTLPMTSIFSGRRFNRGLRRFLGKLRIQDLTVNYFCVSTDILKREIAVHTKGLLWKYVRGSMSLSGFLPPISEKGSLLADGGYCNPVPSDVMRYQMAAKVVISVDVTSEDKREYDDYGTHLSGWWILFNSLNPFAKTASIPSWGDVNELLLWVASQRKLETESVDTADLFLKPPVKHYGTLEFDKFDEIVDVGYQYAKPLVNKFVKENPWVVSQVPHDLNHPATPLRKRKH